MTIFKNQKDVSVQECHSYFFFKIIKEVQVTTFFTILQVVCHTVVVLSHWRKKEHTRQSCLKLVKNIFKRFPINGSFTSCLTLIRQKNPYDNLYFLFL